MSAYYQGFVDSIGAIGVSFPAPPTRGPTDGEHHPHRKRIAIGSGIVGGLAAGVALTTGLLAHQARQDFESTTLQRPAHDAQARYDRYVPISITAGTLALVAGAVAWRLWPSARVQVAPTVAADGGVRWTTHATGPYSLRAGAGTGNALWLATSDGALLTATEGSLTPVVSTPRAWTSMHAVSSTDVWVVGQWGSGSGAYARARHFDGQVWTDISFGGAFDSGWYLTGVSAASSSSVWAVGLTVGNGSVTDLPPGPLVVSYNGVDWTIDRTLPTSSYLRGVWAAAPDDVWAVGDAGTILHFDGTDWSASPSGVSQHLYAARATRCGRRARTARSSARSGPGAGPSSRAARRAPSMRCGRRAQATSGPGVTRACC